MSPARPASRAPLLGFAAAVGSSFCVGLLFVVQKDLLDTIDPGTLNWMQMALIVLMSGTAILVRREERRFPTRAVLPYLLLFGCFGCIVFYMRNVGVALTNATTGSVVVRTEVAMVMLLSYVVLKVKPDLWGWIGAILLFVGAGLSLDLRLDALRFTPWGTVALLSSGAAIAINALIIKTRFGAISNGVTVGANSLVQTVVFGVLVVATGELPVVAEVLADGARLGKVALGAALIFGALYLYYRAMKLIPMWAARAINLLIPPVTAVGDWLWLGSPISTGQIAGLVVVTVGAALVIPSLTREARKA